MLGRFGHDYETVLGDRVAVAVCAGMKECEASLLLAAIVYKTLSHRISSVRRDSLIIHPSYRTFGRLNGRRDDLNVIALGLSMKYRDHTSLLARRSSRPVNIP